MLPSAEEAAQALRDIADIKARAAGFQDYHAEAYQLLLWGTAYVIGFALTALFREQALGIWTLTVLGALLIGVVMVRRSNPDIPGIGRRYLALIGAILLFCALFNVVMWPVSIEQSSMVAPLLVAILYILRGIQLRPRYLLIGCTLLLLSMLGYLFFLPYFMWWMIVACGGTLILSGLWLRYC